MKEFGFYVVKLREGNKKAGTEASDILTGEVDMTSECYKNLDIEEACEIGTAPGQMKRFLKKLDYQKIF